MKINKKDVMEFFIDIISIALIVFIVRTFIVSPFRVSGPSMCNTLNFINERCEFGKGDIMLIDSFSYLNLGFHEIGEPENKDVVVFMLRNGSQKYLVKRIIAVEGETLKIEDGFVYKLIDGDFQKLEEPYLNSENLDQTFLSFANSQTFTVPKDHYFLMGDNRLYSNDSRNCYYKSPTLTCSGENVDAFVHRKQIRGKASLVVFPFQNFGKIN
ncbi:signal peptidase I [bacterium]|jgi:signal peptidase I|nr:signal peptidase I [bacterium]MBT6293728.1 signal peptidase I [bacterium]